MAAESAGPEIADQPASSGQNAPADWPRLLRDHISRVAADPDRRVLALLDGAQIDDLSAALEDHRLVHVSLYDDATDPALIQSGPWLVDPYFRQIEPEASPEEVADDDDQPTDAELEAQAAAMAEEMRLALEAGDETGGGVLVDPEEDTVAADPADQLAALFELVGDKPALVFWVGGADLTATILRRHLRTLNTILAPRSSMGWAAPSAAELAAFPPPREAMTFRHADGNVLAQVLPVLSTEQFARLMGPATELAFHSPGYPSGSGSPIRRAALPDGAPAPAAGLLQLDLDQMNEIAGARQEQSRRNVAGFVREHVPETQSLGDEELRRRVLDYEVSGDAHGLKSESAHMKWAYLMAATYGEVDRQIDTKTFFMESPKHPDERIDDLMDEVDRQWAEAGHLD